MRKGTLLCWLFGHNFVGRQKSVNWDWEGNYKPGMMYHQRNKIDYCRRCGQVDKSNKE